MTVIIPTLIHIIDRPYSLSSADSVITQGMLSSTKTMKLYARSAASSPSHS